MFVLFIPFFIVLIIGTLIGFVAGGTDQDMCDGKKFRPRPNLFTTIIFTYPLGYRAGWYMFRPFDRREQ